MFTSLKVYLQLEGLHKENLLYLVVIYVCILDTSPK